MHACHRTRLIGFCLVLAFAGFTAGPVHAESLPANTLKEMWRALNICLSASRGLEGSEITLVFSLRRDGSMIGKPRISYSKLPGDLTDQKSFVGSVALALSSCMPLRISDGLGGAIAGHPLSIRMVIPRPEKSA